jgi:alanine-synthesizing transaminase
MFSSRTRWDRRENRIALAVKARRAAGLPLVDLTETNPTQVGLPAPSGVLGLLADPSAAKYAPEARGDPAAREAVAADARRRGLDADPEQVVLTTSTSEAYALLFKLLCDPGDGVLVPRPSYPLFDFLAGLEAVDVGRYRLLHDGAWRFDLDDLRGRLTPATRAIVVVNPNNPTGSFLKEDEVEGLLDLCSRHGLALISDEVFTDFAHGPDSRRVAAVDGGDRALTFTLGGLSKSCGLPQLKLGWIIASGPHDLRREALGRLEIIADTYLSVSTPVQRAAPAILARLPELQDPIRERIRRNLAALRRACTGEAAASVLAVEGGWCAILRVPATLSEEERTCQLVEDRGVLVHPGYFFDFEAEAYLVVSLLPDPDAFQRAIEAVVSAL